MITKKKPNECSTAHARHQSAMADQRNVLLFAEFTKIEKNSKEVGHIVFLLFVFSMNQYTLKWSTFPK